MNLKPADAQTAVAPPPGERVPSFKSSSNPGFVHTPSLTQAATVAMLRSGHLAHAGKQMPNDLLAIDLSSERVRLATWLLDGVTTGATARRAARLPVRAPVAGGRKARNSFRSSANLRHWWRENWSRPIKRSRAVAANNVVDGLQAATSLADRAQKPLPLTALFSLSKSTSGRQKPR